MHLFRVSRNVFRFQFLESETGKTVIYQKRNEYEAGEREKHYTSPVINESITDNTVLCGLVKDVAPELVETLRFFLLMDEKDKRTPAQFLAESLSVSEETGGNFLLLLTPLFPNLAASQN